MTDDALKAFDEKLAKANIYGQWTSDAFLQRALDGPRPAGEPHIWKWSDVAGHLDEACRVMPESFTARRSLMFNNPGLARGTTHTLAMGVQMILPGEVAWAHRHSIAALRFVIEGNDRLYTVVDGEACAMEEFDLVLTPGWTWHDHHNESDARAAWLDVLDIPLMMALNQGFYQPYGEKTQPRRDQGEGFSMQVAPPAVRYPWGPVEDRLRDLRGGDGSPYDGIALEYANRVTGGPTMATLSCWAHWLKPGQETQAHRRTSSAVYFVVRGQGRTIVGDSELVWGPRDGFCVPNWAWHHHVNSSKSEEAVLFAVHDIPTLVALGLYREEPEISLDAVVSADFAPPGQQAGP